MKAMITSTTMRTVTGALMEAANKPIRANGSAKTVCGSLTKLR